MWSEDNRFLRHGLAVALLLFVGACLYAHTLKAPFEFDDVFLVNTPLIKNLRNLTLIWQAWPTRFLNLLSFALNYHFSRLQVESYHLVNIAIHLGNALLVWWWARLLCSTPFLRQTPLFAHRHLVALGTGLLFVAHPVQTESVTYIYQRVTSLAAFFYLLAICLYMKARLMDKAAPVTRGSRLAYATAFLFAIAAMFTKEHTVTLPIAVVFIEYAFFPAGDSRRKMAFWFLPLVGLIPLLLLIMKPITATDIWKISATPSSVITYALTQVRVLVTYLRLLVAPLVQNLDYEYPAVSGIINLPFLASAVLLGGLSTLALFCWRKWRIFSFCIFWFFLVLLPESSVIPLADVIFEHRLYLPMAGFSLGICALFLYTVGRYSRRRMCLYLALLVCGYGVLTCQRNQLWNDEVRLWDDTVRKSSHKARAYLGRGIGYYHQGRWLPAVADFTQAISLDSGYSDAYRNRGIVYELQGRFKEALKDFTTTIELRPNSAEAHGERAGLYVRIKEYQRALADLDRAIALDPAYADAYNTRGDVYLQQDQQQKAVADYQRAARFDRYYAGMYSLRLAELSAQKGDYTTAYGYYQKALAANPLLAEGYNGRGNVYAQQGSYPQAIADFTLALKINPYDPDAYNNRGLTYAAMGDFPRAGRDYTQALALRPDYPQVYNNRGNAAFAQGNYPQALRDYTQALTLAPAYPEAYTNRGNLYTDQGQYELALADYQQTLKLAPQSVEAYNGLASLYAKKGEYARAVAEYKKALQIAPRHGGIYYNLAVTYFFLHDYDQSWKALHQAAELGVSPYPRFLATLKQLSGREK